MSGIMYNNKRAQEARNSVADDDEASALVSSTVVVQFPEIKYVPPLTSQTLLKSSEMLSDEKLNEYMIQCVTCDDQQFRLFELFNHALEVHSVYTCVMCLSQFKFSRELMVHLHRAHSIKSEVFESPHQFLAAGGTRTYLSCGDCGMLFNLMSSTDTNSFISHHCVGTKDSRSADASVSSEGCTSCGKQFSPSDSPNKILTHNKSCACNNLSENDKGERGTPPALRKEGTVSPAARMKRRKLAAMPELNPMVMLSPKKTNGWMENDHEQEDKTQNSSRPDVEVTVVSRRGGRGGRGRGTSRRSSLSGLSTANQRSQLGNNIDKLEFQVKEEKNVIESDVNESSTMMDPLLMEKDPVKRLNLLVEELSSRLSKQWPGPEMPGYTRNEPDDSQYDITINYKVENKVDDEVLAQMLSLTCINCAYCRQVKLIKVDKRQLAVHLFSKHLWNLKFSSVDDSISSPKQCTEAIKTEDKMEIDTSGDIDGEIQTSQSKQDSSPNANDLDKKLPSADSEPMSEGQGASDRKSEITESSSSNNENENNKVADTCSVENKALSGIPDSEANDEESQKNMTENQSVPDTTDILETKNLDNEESQASETNPDIKSDDACVLKISEDSKESLTTQDLCNISWDDFKLAILRKVFLSKDVVFSYDNGYEFGEAPCECLLCGYSVETQKNLFPHWRKIHRGVAMRCAMCQGRFLFAGALFSHLCLGTPNPLVKNEVINGPPTTGGKCTSQPDSHGKGPGGDLQMSDVNTEDGSADTIVLRYQCNICRNLQLPGFFNYMIHMRKDHIRCELCLEHMASQRDLEHHMKKHKLNHFCWKCGVTYCAKPNFMTHLFWKHGSESKECSNCLKKKWPHIYHFCVPPTHFVCDVCEFFFTKPKCLVVHKRLHTGEKKHKCTVRKCDQRFISKKLMKKHVESDHNTSSQPLAILHNNDAPIKAEDNTESDLKPVISENIKDENTEEIKPAVAEVLQAAVDTLPSVEAVEPMKDPKPSLKLVIKTVPDKQSDEPEIKLEKANSVEETNEQLPLESQTSNTVDQEPIIAQTDENNMEVDEGDGKKPFDLLEIQGPNLSEDESDRESEGGVHKSKSGGSRRKLRRLLIAAAKSPSMLKLLTSNDNGSISERTVPIELENFPNPNAVSPSPVDNLPLEVPVTNQNSSEHPCENPINVSQPDMIELDKGSVKHSPKEITPSETPVQVEEKITEVEIIKPSTENMKQVANDLVLSEDSNSSTSSDSDDDRSKDDNSDAEDSKQKEDGKIAAVTDLLDQCENLEKNLNQSAMDVEDSFKKVATLGLELNPSDLMEDPEKIKPQDDFGSMSPLLPPLDDFNFNVPDIPTFEDNTLPDHIIRENALFSVYNEHDYCLRQDSKRLQAPNLNRSPVHSSHSRHSASPKKKKKKSMKQKKKTSKNDHSRKRRHSSSSSSSSSSSCSSCGSNCSCSSSSSSTSSSSSEDSSSDNEDQDKTTKNSNVANVPYSIHLPHPSPNNSIPVKRGRGRPKGSINRNKDGIPTAKKWTKIKMSHGHRSHSQNQNPVPSQQSVNSDGSKPKRKYRKKKGLYTRKISNHPEKENSKAEEEQSEIPEENFILETDLETDESGSEEVYSQKQMNEVIGRRSALDEIWTMSNEQYLLLMVKGVKELKDLQPPPRSNIQELQQRSQKRRLPDSTYYSESKPTYSVQPATTPVSRLKVRNVPIKPLIVRRNLSVKSSPDFEYSRKSELSSENFHHQSTYESFPSSRVNGSDEPKIKLHISKKPNSMGSYSKSVITSRPAAASNHPQLGDRIPFVKLEDVSSKALEHGIVINPPTVPTSTVRRPKTKIGTGRGGRKSSTVVNIHRVTPSMHVTADTPMDSSLTNNIKEEVYCFCQCPHDNVSQMIGCDADDCEFQWFHFECVGVTIPPKGKWFCPDCRNKRRNKSAEQRKDRVKEEGWNHNS